jgi:HTH-type transcriptional regulator/antitoxin HigA
MTSTFDNKTYSQLLAEIPLQVIETEDEYERILKVAEHLTLKKILLQRSEIWTNYLSE